MQCRRDRKISYISNMTGDMKLTEDDTAWGGQSHCVPRYREREK